MGAELIGLLLKGPKTLDPKLKQVALEAAEKVVAQAALAQHDEDFELGKYEHLQGLDFEPEYDLERMAGIDPKRLLEELKTVWEDHDARDVAWRVDPDNEEVVLVFTGEMSWGGDPDGFAYRILRNADLIGILAIFGIR